MRGSRFSSGMFPDEMFGSFGEGGGSMGGGPRKAPPIENRLPCSLEDLYKGTTKKMKISREIADISGYVAIHFSVYFCFKFQSFALLWFIKH